MAIVTTDNKHYTAIADSIRTNTGTENTYTPEEMAEGVNEVYEAGQYSMVDESKIIEKTVSGTNMVVVDDTSEIPHDVGCKVESVNLYHTDYNSGTSNGITVTRNADGSFSVSGTATGAVYIHLGYCSVNEDFAYYCSGGTSRARLAYQLSEDGKSQFTTIVSVEDIVSTGEILHSTPVKFINPVICVNSGETVNEVVKPMISLIETSEYTPYVDVSGVTVTRCGENLFNPSNLLYEHEYYPWTEKDGVYSGYSHGLFLKCQNGESAFVSNCFAPNTQYVFTFKGRVNGFTLDTGETVYEGLVFRFSYTDGSSSEITLNSADETTFTLVSTAGKTVSGLYLTYFRNVINYIKEPQLSVYIPNADTGYEPYEGQTVQANADGTVDGIKSLCPIMTLSADVNGVALTVDYHKSWGKQAEYDAFWDVYQKKGERTHYSYGFAGSEAWNDDTFKPKYDIRPIETALYLFFQNGNMYGTGITDLTKEAIGVELDLSNCKEIRHAFYGCMKLKRIGVISALSVPGGQYALQALFQWDVNLEEVEKIILKDDGSQGMPNIFGDCGALREVRFEGKTGYDLSFSSCKKLSKESIISSINVLLETSSGKTLTLSLTAVQNAFETSEGAADGSTSEEWLNLVATKSNWTITLV